MSVGLENMGNTSAVDADYPWKNIRDNAGLANGTEVNKRNHADYHQTFRKLLADADITPNGLEDNVTNGYQYIDALRRKYKRAYGVLTLTGGHTMVANDMNKLIEIKNSSMSSYNVSILDANDMLDGDSIIVILTQNTNNQFSSSIQTPTFGQTINGLASVELYSAGDYVELILDKPNDNWVIRSSKITLPWINMVSAPALDAQWVPFSGLARYRVGSDKIVRFNGQVTKNPGDGSGTSVVFTLPVGARPSVAIVLPCTSFDGTNFINNFLNITTAGVGKLQIETNAVQNDIYLTGLSFPID